jgi:lytic murein transglycosylase
MPESPISGHWTFAGFFGQRADMTIRMLACGLLLLLPAMADARADAAFQGFVQSLWPEAQKLGVSRATFDAATRGLKPDPSLPDLLLPGHPERPPPPQAEFVQTPESYVRETTIARLAAQGRKLAQAHSATLSAIERQFGVAPAVILAIWGRETAYGGHRLPHNAVQALATQAYLGRRKEQFREEFLLALKILEEGHVRLADMRSSWAGAMGHTQFLPSEFYKHAVDFDGDGKRDIWNSVPDALASAARQLVAKGWQSGRRWAYEVRMPSGIDCTIAQPGHRLAIGEWLRRGYAPAYGRKPSAAERDEQASLLLPEGTYGPAFLTPKNYFVIKDYNFSDLYVLFVGHLSDRIEDARPFETPWSKNSQLRTGQVEAMQRRLTELGLYRDKIDGKAGMLTRAALGAYQKANGLKLDCWPTAAVLAHMQGRR